MKIRYAKQCDFEFLIEGLERNRIIENRPKKDIKARASDKKDFKKAIKKKNIRIVEDAGQPIAFLYFRTDFKVMYIYDKFLWIDLIYVKEGFRGKGLGTLLYKDVQKIAKRKGYKRIIIDIFKANDKSYAFHKKRGFAPIYTIYEKRT